MNLKTITIAVLLSVPINCFCSATTNDISIHLKEVNGVEDADGATIAD